MYFVRLHLGLCLEQGEGEGGHQGRKTLNFWGFPSQTLCAP